MKSHEEYAEDVAKKAERVLEASLHDDFSYLGEEEGEMRGLVYLTSLYGTRLAEELDQDEHDDPGLKYAAERYLSSPELNQGFRGP